MNGTWHDDLENAASVQEAVVLVRGYLGALPPHRLGSMSRCCDPRRIAADQDIDDLTFRLSQAQRLEPEGAVDETVLREAFDLLLHASLRISHLNRMRAEGRALLTWRPQMSQMS
jgi:hypothetical protein